MIFFYKTIVNIIFILVIPFLPLIYLFKEKRRATLWPRLGFKTRLMHKLPGKKRIWIHALSVGEVVSSIPFVTALKEQYTALDIVFTASTKTGFDRAAQLLIEKPISQGMSCLVGQLAYFPYDLGFSVKKIIRRIDPDAVVIVETDVWPNFLYELKKSHIPVLLINARLSNRSLKGYLRFRAFAAQVFSAFAAIMVQTPMDKERFGRLGLDPDKILVAGNIKFDQPQNIPDKGKTDALAVLLGVSKDTKVIIAGSTHEGEEKILCAVFKVLVKEFPELLMILAPRDPKRCQGIRSYCASQDVLTVLMSTLYKEKRTSPVILVDRMGELYRLYSVCDVAFVGGSLVARGGHNPLEPAAFSKPILFGSDMSDFLLISKMLVTRGGAKTVSSGQDLEKELVRLLKDPPLCRQMGRQNFTVFSTNSGAVQKIINHMEHLHFV